MSRYFLFRLNSDIHGVPLFESSLRILSPFTSNVAGPQELADSDFVKIRALAWPAVADALLFLFLIAGHTEDVRKPVSIAGHDRFFSDNTVAVQQITMVDPVGFAGRRPGACLRVLGR